MSMNPPQHLSTVNPVNQLRLIFSVCTEMTEEKEEMVKEREGEAIPMLLAEQVLNLLAFLVQKYKYLTTGTKISKPADTAELVASLTRTHTHADVALTTAGSCCTLKPKDSDVTLTAASAAWSTLTPPPLRTAPLQVRMLTYADVC